MSTTPRTSRQAAHDAVWHARHAITTPSGGTTTTLTKRLNAAAKATA